MLQKGSIAPDGRTLRTNAGIVKLPGRGRVNAIKIGGWDEEIGTVDLPDFTSASAGDSEPFDLAITFAAQDTETNNWMNEWWLASKDQVPGYKKIVTLMYPFDRSGNTGNIVNMHGCHVKKRGVPEVTMGPRGELLGKTWVLRVNEARDV